jgi:hypothetical protein
MEHHAMKTRGELEKPLHTFYTLVLDRQRVVNLILRSLYPGNQLLDAVKEEKYL